jgi:hypothetical protein
VELTYGKEAFDSSATPVSEDQIPASPVLMFKAPPGTVFLADVEISISVDKSVLVMLFGSDTESESDERRKHVGGNRKLLLASATVQELKQHWFNTATMVCCVCLLILSWRRVWYHFREHLRTSVIHAQVFVQAGYTCVIDTHMFYVEYSGCGFVYLPSANMLCIHAHTRMYTCTNTDACAHIATQQWVMIADSVVDPASGKVTSDVSKEVLNSPDYNGQLTVLLVTITKDPPPVTTTTTASIMTTPAPVSSCIVLFLEPLHDRSTCTAPGIVHLTV